MRSAADELAALIAASDWFIRVLTAVRDTQLPDAWTGAGVLRDLVWSQRSGGVFNPATVRDVDVAFFDSADLSRERDQGATEALRARLPSVPWEATNQAAVHTWYNDVFGGPPVPPLLSTADGVSTWPETATSVAVRLQLTPPTAVGSVGVPASGGSSAPVGSVGLPVSGGRPSAVGSVVVPVSGGRPSAVGSAVVPVSDRPSEAGSVVVLVSGDRPSAVGSAMVPVSGGRSTAVGSAVVPVSDRPPAAMGWAAAPVAGGPSAAAGLGASPAGEVGVVAVLLDSGERLEICAPFGLADLLGGVWRRNPRRITVSQSLRRLGRHEPARRWPGVRVIKP